MRDAREPRGRKAMIVSYAATDEAPTGSASICIVGAGAAGITLACELDGCGVKVLLLEAGGTKPDLAASTEHYRGTATAPHPAPHEYRRAGLGGTTPIWGGRCVPFDPIDFERRDHVPHSGWPIAYDDVARHYPRALAYCHAGAFDFTVAGSLTDARPTVPGLGREGDALLDRIERYSLPTHFGRDHREQLARSDNVTVLLGARCLRLRKKIGEDVIEAVEVVDRAGRRGTIRAAVFVVACGGIETTRLLFASDRDGAGLGNRTDRLGRFYACHFEKVVARLVAGDAPVAFDFERSKDDVYVRRKLQFSADAQRTHRLLNTAFRLHFPDYSDASHRSGVMSTIFLAKSTLIAEYRQILQHGAEGHAPSPRMAHVRNMILGAPAVAKFGYDWLFKRVLARRKLPYTLMRNADDTYPIEFNSEQMPLATNRLTMGSESDRDGMRRVHVHWAIGEDDVQAARRAFVLLRERIAATTPCRVEFDEATLLARLRSAVPVGGHHIGTARMAISERDGVVDRDGAVFGLPNLFVASAATFPTSSHANPTLTIVALAIRLAAHLKAMHRH